MVFTYREQLRNIHQLLAQYGRHNTKIMLQNQDHMGLYY